MNSQFSSSATLSAVLFEQIFTTRLVREKANPSGFTPAKENVQEQLQNLLNQANSVINTEKKSFRSITKELKVLDIIDKNEKEEYDSFYKNVRNPVAHGLTLRLFQRKYDRLPNSIFELDSSFENIYQSISHELIAKIHELMTKKALRKQ